MSQAFFSVLKRFFAYILSLFAVLNLSPNKSEAPDDGGSDSAPYVFSSAEDYSNYYFYCLEETPEPYTWSPEALAARDNVERVCSAEGFSVTLFKNITARINALNGPVRDVVIPAEVEGYPVVAVFSILPWRDSDNASKIAAAVKSVVIPNTVEYIMDGAFEDLSNLRSVRFGNRVRYMEANAFRDCTCLTGVILLSPASYCRILWIPCLPSPSAAAARSPRSPSAKTSGSWDGMHSTIAPVSEKSRCRKR